MLRPVAGPVAALSCAALVGAGAASAEPVNESAQAVIDDLTGQGYNVEINWVSGVSSGPLTECAALGVHNPDSSGGPPATFTTVYVDVSCPNHDGPGSAG